MEKKFKEQYTFKPNVGKQNENRDKTPENKKEFLKRLSTPKLMKLSSRSTLTTAYTEVNLNRDKSKESLMCFKPLSKEVSRPISRPISRPESVSKSKSKSKSKEINDRNTIIINPINKNDRYIYNERTERLFKLATERNIRKNSQMRQNADDKIKNFTFKPLVDDNSKKINNTKLNIREKRPLFERVIYVINIKLY
jgi:hypothetical protein